MGSSTHTSPSDAVHGRQGSGFVALGLAIGWYGIRPLAVVLSVLRATVRDPSDQHRLLRRMLRDCEMNQPRPLRLRSRDHGASVSSSRLPNGNRSGSGSRGFRPISTAGWRRVRSPSTVRPGLSMSSHPPNGSRSIRNRLSSPSVAVKRRPSASNGSSTCETNSNPLRDGYGLSGTRDAALRRTSDRSRRGVSYRGHTERQQNEILLEVISSSPIAPETVRVRTALAGSVPDGGRAGFRRCRSRRHRPMTDCGTNLTIHPLQ